SVNSTAEDMRDHDRRVIPRPIRATFGFTLGSAAQLCRHAYSQIHLRIPKQGNTSLTVGSKRDAKAAADDPLEIPWTAPTDGAGGTVFDDRALRFRSLTVSDADLSVLEAPQGFHTGFKIRVARLGGPQREAGKLVERRYAGRGYSIPIVSNEPQLAT